MAVITQYYDIDLRATGEYPVVKMSQFDTGSRTIVFTVYDGHDLAHIDGMVARVDGTRSDGVEFSSTCTVGTGSRVSFTISQEMTKHAGKHAAELVIFDADGDPIGTQNFVIDVEAAPMVRDSAASADDRTLYDQYTDSVSKRVADKITQMDDSVNKTVNDKMAGVDSKMAGVDSKMASVDSKMAGVDAQISSTVDTEIGKRAKPDPAIGAWADYTVDGTVHFAGDNSEHFVPLKLKSHGAGADTTFGTDAGGIEVYRAGVYQMTIEGFYKGGTETAGRDTRLYLYPRDGSNRWWDFLSTQGAGSTGARNMVFRGVAVFYVPDGGLPCRLSMSTSGSSAISLDASSMNRALITRIGDGSAVLKATELPAATTSRVGGVKIGAGINVAADGTIDVQALVDKIDHMRSMYDALSPATYEVGSGLTKGPQYDDWAWDFCRLRVVGGVCTLSISGVRGSTPWNAHGGDDSNVLFLPAGLGVNGYHYVPMATNANGEPANNTLLRIADTSVSFTSAVDVTYSPGTWFDANISWVASGE